MNLKITTSSTLIWQNSFSGWPFKASWDEKSNTPYTSGPLKNHEGFRA